jgi:hypothetical protein
VTIKKLRSTLSSITILAAVFILLPVKVLLNAAEEFRGDALTLSAPGVALEKPDTLLVAARLNNTGTKTALNVQIESINFDFALRVLPAKFPALIGDIGPNQYAILEASFKSGHLIPGKKYVLLVRGRYTSTNKQGGEDQHHDSSNHQHASHETTSMKESESRDDRHHPGEETRHEFTAEVVIMLPPAAPGSAPLRTGAVRVNHISGAPFPALPPNFNEEVNGSRWTVPTGAFVPGIPTPSGTSTQKAPLGDPNSVTFIANNGFKVNDNPPTEPSGATGGGVVFVTANFIAAFSTDGGSNFTQLNPTTIFPSDAVGFCCDQAVQYVPSIDRFIWLLQGAAENGVRLASASPGDIMSSKGTAWTYWNLTPDVFGQPAGTGFDYPDLSVGTNYLYLSWDNGWPNCPSGCSSGREVARVALGEIKAGGTIEIDYTNPSDSPMAWGDHLTQNTGDEVFWAGHNTNKNMRVFSLAESSGTYFWRDVEISSWANNALSSTTPDGQNWLAFGFPGNAPIGATRSSNQIWFAWNAGTDDNFSQPHVELATLDRNNNFGVISREQIWNDNYAFAYPALTTNTCTGEIGLSLEYGGNGNYENHVVGFWGDFIVYITTNSNVGTTRFGDYVTIRQDPTPGLNGAFFDAFGYGLDTVPPPGSGSQSDLRYVVFGRGGACASPSPPR